MIPATLYKRPNGEREPFQVTNILPEDAEYIKNNDITVSMEDAGFLGYVIYFDDGRLLDDEETPDELIVFADGKYCEETFAKAVKLLKKRATNNVKKN